MSQNQKIVIGLVLLLAVAISVYFFVPSISVFVTYTRPYLEALYFLSGIAIAGGVLVSMRQLSILKLDIVGRGERAAKEKAVDMTFRLADLMAESIRGQRVISDKLNLPARWIGPVGNFSISSLSEDQIKISKKRHGTGIPSTYLNPLEAVSASFTNGIADEKIAFPMCGESFCAFVSAEYDMFCIMRTNETTPPFSNTVKLYEIWSNRLTKRQLQAARDGLTASMEQIPDQEVPPLSPLPGKAV